MIKGRGIPIANALVKLIKGDKEWPDDDEEKPASCKTVIPTKSISAPNTPQRQDDADKSGRDNNNTAVEAVPLGKN